MLRGIDFAKYYECQLNGVQSTLLNMSGITIVKKSETQSNKSHFK